MLTVIYSKILKDKATQKNKIVSRYFQNFQEESTNHFYQKFPANGQITLIYTSLLYFVYLLAVLVKKKLVTFCFF